VFRALPQQLLSVLQLTRMALVCTAISNSLCALMLWAQWNTPAGGHVSDLLTFWRALAVAVTSAGLYGFGMCLNDINDRRRDSLIAAHRPLPSGRIGVAQAHVVCGLLALTALVGGGLVARFTDAPLLSLGLVVWTGVLITFYDFAGKYLVAPGLLTLGLIRFFHATIAAPKLPLLWHPLLLLNHVAIISALAYAWEAKRPALTRVHWWAVLGGLALADVTCIALVGWRRVGRVGDDWLEALRVTPGLVLPAIAVAMFVIVASWVRATLGNTRRAGQSLMLSGLLWLIVYDAAFAGAYVDWTAAAMLLFLLPIAYLSVLLMRWWGQVLSAANAEIHAR
jgi:hypothetical protein